ncbi:hypothetical protein V8E55_007771 [Tylopilus felleus]
MTIPVFRHNQDHDDWEVASVYDSDDCDSLGRSGCNEPLQSGSFDDPGLRLRRQRYDNARPVVRYSVPQQQPQSHPPVALARPRWDARYVPGKQNNFIVPPPGIIFPSKDRLLLPQDTYWPPGQMASSSDRLLEASLAEPPPSSLLLSPSSPPHPSSSLIKLPPPKTTIGHGQPPHATSVTMSSTGPNVNGHASPMMGPPPRYHEVAPSNAPRLAEAGCQAHSGMGQSPPRRSGHDVLTPTYGFGPGHATMMRRGPSSEEMTIVDGRTGYGGHASYGPGDRPDQLPSQEYGYDGGTGRTTARAQTRERRPSIWRRFVRRFGPSRVSVGQT